MSQVYVSRRNSDLVVVDKVNGGKSDALNAGLRVARHPLFAAINAEPVMDGDALLEVARPFFDDPEQTVASGGVVRVSNGCTIDHGRVLGMGCRAACSPASSPSSTSVPSSSAASRGAVSTR